MPWMRLLNRQISHEDVKRDGEEFFIQVLVGRNDVTDRTYAISAGLSPAPPGTLEYVFSLIQVEGETGAEIVFRNGLSASTIPKEIRREILYIILRATKLLVEVASPDCIFMCTMIPDLPKKALEKFHRVNEVFAECGYTVTECEPYHGKRSWWAERNR
jgi:hypothetical protein